MSKGGFGMYCLKCGAETPNQQLFCPACLESMDAYPVRADTPVHLPKRQNQTPVKRTKQKEVPPEIQLAKLRSKVRRLTLSVCLLILALAVVLTAFFFQLFQKGELPSLAGSHYTVTEQL